MLDGTCNFVLTFVHALTLIYKDKFGDGFNKTVLLHSVLIIISRYLNHKQPTLGDRFLNKKQNLAQIRYSGLNPDIILLRSDLKEGLVIQKPGFRF